MRERDRWSKEYRGSYEHWGEKHRSLEAEDEMRRLYGGEARTSYRGRGPRGYRRSDQRIKEDVSDRFADDRYLDASEIEVDVHAGEVTLTGMVDSRGARRRAEEIAEQVSGVTYVQNNLRVRQQGTMGLVGGYGTPAAAAYGLAASPSADASPGVAEASTPAPAGSPEAKTGESTAGARNHTIIALFDTQAEAERAIDDLVAVGVDRTAVSLVRDDATEQAPPEPSRERGLLATLASLFLPNEDRHAYAEGIRRGAMLLSVIVDERRADEVAATLETAGAVDLDARKGEWRAAGWRDYEPLPAEEDPAQVGGFGEAIAYGAAGTVAHEPRRSGSRTRIYTPGGGVGTSSTERTVTTAEQKTEI